MNNTSDTSQLVQVYDRAFEPMIPAEEIRLRVIAMAEEISTDYTTKNPLVIAVLNGAFIFAADLLRALDFDPEIAFIKLSSYQKMATTGEIRELIGLDRELEGRDVLIIEDIIDTGHTIAHLHNTLISQKAGSIAIATLLLKTGVYGYDVPLRYVGFEIPNRFVVGYGLDYEGYGRSLPGIFVLHEG